jgi:hypothetical protein
MNLLLHRICYSLAWIIVLPIGCVLSAAIFPCLVAIKGAELFFEGFPPKDDSLNAVKKIQLAAPCKSIVQQN